MLDGDEAGDVAVAVADRRDRGLYGVEGAVLAAISYLAFPDMTGDDSSPEFAIEAAVMFARLEGAWCFPDDLFRRIARQGAERPD